MWTSEQAWGTSQAKQPRVAANDWIQELPSGPSKSPGRMAADLPALSQRLNAAAHKPLRKGLSGSGPADSRVGFVPLSGRLLSSLRTKVWSGVLSPGA